MLTAAATWGYLGANSDYTTWNADYIVEKPAAILKLLN